MNTPDQDQKRRQYANPTDGDNPTGSHGKHEGGDGAAGGEAEASDTAKQNPNAPGGGNTKGGAVNTGPTAGGSGGMGSNQ